jgi:4-methoxybenzoate monooxygenase (O-demethylating)
VLHEILMRQLGRASLRRWQPRIQDSATALIADALDTGPGAGRGDGLGDGVDVVPLARQLAVTTAADLAGLPAEGRAALAGFSRAAFTALGPAIGQHAGQHAEGLARLGEMAEYLTGVVRRGELAEHSAGADILDAAAAHRIDAPTVVQLLAALVTAGIDTAATAITNLIWLLGTHPSIWRRLRAGTVTVADTATEALRVESPIRCLTRTATADTTVSTPEGHRVTVPAGDGVLVCYGAANRDPHRWSDPDRFDPTRPRRTHLAFGRGLHACTGQALATAQLHAVTRALLAGVDELAAVPHLAHRLRHPVINGFAQLPVALRPATHAVPA